jgi:hypothetical protein
MSSKILEELYQSYESDSDDEDYVCKEGKLNKK